MSTAHTGIAWTDRTWNPTRGCRRISPGCASCYAERVAYRFSGKGQPYEGLVELGKTGPRWTGQGALVPRAMEEPLSWRKPERIFVNSMSDLFFEAFTDIQIAALFGVMSLASHHTFQILTKRADRMLDLMSRLSLEACIDATLEMGLSGPTTRQTRAIRDAMPKGSPFAHDSAAPPWPLPNVWLGVSVEDQKHAGERIASLLATPAAVRFISYEPALGPVDLWAFLDGRIRNASLAALKSPRMPGLNWAIVGGESGPGARPFHVEWARAIVVQCRDAGVPAFVKQLGAHVRWDGMSNPDEHWPTGTRSEDDRRGGFRVHLKDKAGADPAEWPEDLRVQEFPTTPQQRGPS